MRRHGWVFGCWVISCLTLLPASGCKEAARRAPAFADEIARIASREGGEADEVARAIRSTSAEGGLAQDELVRAWSAAPPADVRTFADELDELASRHPWAGKVLQRTACDAIEQALAEQEWPTAEDVGRHLIENLSNEAVPATMAVSLASDFKELIREQARGGPVVLRLRLMVLKGRHC